MFKNKLLEEKEKPVRERRILFPNKYADNGECEYDACLGCTDPTACNYDVSASQDDGSCVQPAYECLDGTIKCHESECDI